MGQSKWQKLANAKKLEAAHHRKMRKKDPKTNDGQCHFLDLPEELIEYICATIPGTDLPTRLRLALCCKMLYRIIVPVHLNSWAHIRFSPFQLDTWTYLALGGEEMAERVKKLELMEANSSHQFKIPVLPDSNLGAQKASQPDQRHSEFIPIKEMLKVVRGMVNLEELAWGYPNRTVLKPELDDEVWAVFQGLPIRRLLVDSQSSWRNVSIWRFENLTSLRLAQREAPEGSEGLMPELLNMLVRKCPMLETLALKLPNADLQPLFEQGNWPRLQYLDCCAGPAPGGLTEFLLRHPTITQLRLRLVDLNGETLPITIAGLPKLEELFIPRLNPLDEIDRDSMRNVRRLGAVVPTNGNLQKISTMPKLRYLSLHLDRHTIPVYHGAPLKEVQQLYLDGGDVYVDNTESFEAWITFLSHFPNATHIGSIHILADHRRDKVLRRFAAALPKLYLFGSAFGHWFEKVKGADGIAEWINTPVAVSTGEVSREWGQNLNFTSLD